MGTSSVFENTASSDMLAYFLITILSPILFVLNITGYLLVPLLENEIPCNIIS